MAEKRAGGERETESVQGNKQKGQKVGATRSSAGVSGARRPAGAKLSRRPAVVRRVLHAPRRSLRLPASPGCAAQAAAGAVVAAAKCEASGCRQQTYVPGALGAALAELACPEDAPARGVSHRDAALGRQGRAGQGKLDSWRCWARLSLAARTGPSSSAAHKPMARRPLPRAGLPRPRGGRGGHRGVGGGDPELKRRAYREPPAEGAPTLG